MEPFPAPNVPLVQSLSCCYAQQAHSRFCLFSLCITGNDRASTVTTPHCMCAFQYHVLRQTHWLFHNSQMLQAACIHHCFNVHVQSSSMEAALHVCRLLQVCYSLALHGMSLRAASILVMDIATASLAALSSYPAILFCCYFFTLSLPVRCFPRLPKERTEQSDAAATIPAQRARQMATY